MRACRCPLFPSGRSKLSGTDHMARRPCWKIWAGLSLYRGDSTGTVKPAELFTRVFDQYIAICHALETEPQKPTTLKSMR
jgi:hypothetical protein